LRRSLKKPATKADLSRAERNIAWCERELLIPEGRYVGEPLRMAEFMREDFRAIYDNPAGTRRAIISRGRKNAKTMECACILLLHLCGPEAKAYPNASLYSAAQSRDQAALVFALAAKMIRQSEVLSGNILIKDAAKQLICPHFGTSYRALSAESTTAFGLSPTLILHDELGQVRGPRSALYEALETATAAQAEPLSIIISTQASSDQDLLSTLIDDAKAGHDPRTVLRLDTAPMDLDPFAEGTIRMANPALDVFMNRQEVLEMAAGARRMPARQAEYENLVLNRRIEVNSPFVTQIEWKACGGAVADLHNVPLYGGLDLSSVADLTAFVLIGRVDGAWHVKPTFWLPGIGLAEKSMRDRIPYDLWEQQKFLRTTPGNSVSYEHVAEQLKALFNEYDIRKVGFDPWAFKHLQPWLVKAGFTEQLIAEKFAEFRQGTYSMTPALRDFEAAIKERQLAHGNNPVLQMCAANAIVEGTDTARKLSKARSIGRIDGMVALTMAFGVAPMAKTVDVSTLIA
jgi:phage terminase large subunit-like protein